MKHFTEYLTGEKNKQIEILFKLLEKTASNGYIPPISFVQGIGKKIKKVRITLLQPNPVLNSLNSTLSFILDLIQLNINVITSTFYPKYVRSVFCNIVH